MVVTYVCCLSLYGVGCTGKFNSKLKMLPTLWAPELLKHTVVNVRADDHLENWKKGSLHRYNLFTFPACCVLFIHLAMLWDLTPVNISIGPVNKYKLLES